MLFMYIFLGMGPQVQKGENGLAFVIEFVIGAALVGIVYSYITEYNIYIAFVKNILGIDKSTELMYLRVQSFILHPNAFGMVCMLGIIFCFISGIRYITFI